MEMQRDFHAQQGSTTISLDTALHLYDQFIHLIRKCLEVQTMGLLLLSQIHTYLQNRIQTFYKTVLILIRMVFVSCI